MGDRAQFVPDVVGGDGVDGADAGDLTGVFVFSGTEYSPGE
jgi:hypothetical protein